MLRPKITSVAEVKLAPGHPFAASPHPDFRFSTDAEVDTAVDKVSKIWPEFEQESVEDAMSGVDMDEIWKGVAAYKEVRDSIMAVGASPAEMMRWPNLRNNAALAEQCYHRTHTISEMCSSTYLTRTGMVVSMGSMTL